MTRITLVAVAVAGSWLLPHMGGDRDVVLLLYATALVLAARTPLELFGSIRPNAWRVALVCGIPVLLTLVVYRLTSQPFRGSRIGIWLVSPLAQELLFTGFVFGVLERKGPRTQTWRPTRALLATAVLFSLWHLPNLSTLPVRYVLFQLLYTFAGCLVAGLSRQWTGSILYATATHTLVNYIAWLP